MSLDKSLKKASSLARARNVLSRAERLALLQEDERWQPVAGVYNLPKTKYRRQMKKRFFKTLYGQRWQVESVFSRHKRKQSSELRSKTWLTQQAEIYLRVLVHNLAFLWRLLIRFSTEQVLLISSSD